MLPDMGVRQLFSRLQHDWLRAGLMYLGVQAATLAAAGFQGGSFRPAFLVYAAGVASTPALLFAVTLLLLGQWRPRQRGSLVLTAVCASSSALLCLDSDAGEFRAWTMEALILAAPAAALLVHGIAGRDRSRPAPRPRPRTFADQVFLYMALLLAGTAAWLVVEMELVVQYALVAVPIAIMLAFALTSFMALPFILGLGLARKLRPHLSCTPWHPAISAAAHLVLWLLWVYTDEKEFVRSFWMLFILPLAFGLGVLLWSRAEPARSHAC